MIVVLCTDLNSYMSPSTAPIKSHRDGDDGIIVRKTKYLKQGDMVYIDERSERVIKVERTERGLHPRN